MTPADAAQFRIRVLLWWGTLLLLGGLGFRWLVLNASPTGGAEAQETLWVARVVLLVALGGAAMLGTGLVAVGVRIGLTAHGIDAVAEPTEPATPRDP